MLLDADLAPFLMDVPESELEALHDRLARTRWLPDFPDPDWTYGVGQGYLRQLVDYWQHGYRWRAWEDRFNSYPQYLTRIDGQRVHLLHVRSPQPGAIPLVLSHGWPGSIGDFLDVLGPLTQPDLHGARGAPAFDVVLPSLPGYGFSGPTTEPGWDADRIGRTWATLMGRLGYQRYAVGGNDAGSTVSMALARACPDAVIGVHVTQIWSEPRGDSGELDGLSEADQAALDARNWFRSNLGAYELLHGQQPHTIAHALADSPVGLLAWYCQIYRDELDADAILTDVTLTWLTGTVASNLRLYYEIQHAPVPTEPTRVPVGLAQFDNDFVSMRRFAERDHHNIVSWNSYDAPGHYAGRQSPGLLVNDIRTFFAGLR
jgi:pimeloyl-ACP methyl ester carboxylesterase